MYNWNGTRRFFVQHQSRSPKPRLWEVNVTGDTINTTWGQQDGKMQSASEKAKGVNLGKANAKSPQVYALECAVDMIRRKRWEGYREWDPSSGKLLEDAVVTEMDFDNLPPTLSFYKPDNSMGAGITKKAAAGGVWYSRKRNGECYILARGTGAPKLYSRRILRQHHLEVGTPYTWDDRFPHIIANAAATMPPNSILLGELVVSDGNNKDLPYDMDRWLKVLTPEALEMQKTARLPQLYVWDVAFWNGVPLVKEAPVSIRYELLCELYRTNAPITPVEFFNSDYFHNSTDNAIGFAKEHKWEGFVVVVPEDSYGDVAYNFAGKPRRPGSSCAKLKPVFEDDFIAYWDPAKGYGEYSTKQKYATNGKNGIESIALFQFNSHGQMVFISMCASGLKDNQKKEWADPQFWPVVVKVEYTDRRYISDGDETNSLDFPRFIEKRTDKLIVECVNPKL